MDRIGRQTIRPYLTEQHRTFYLMLPFIVVGTVDGDGAPWTTLLSGDPGFLQSPDASTLTVQASRDPSDPADRGIADGNAIGLLGIDLHTRRRNRLNGAIRRRDDTEFDVRVLQSFGNCPRYIQQRDAYFVRSPHQPFAGRVETLSRLDAAAFDTIRAADTFFVATYVDRDGAGRQVDVSHRGGRPGFVRVEQDGTLVVPDFAGNLHFATLGNILMNPRAGLLFVDFSTGDMLQISGAARVVTDSPEIGAFAGAERLWYVTPHQVVRRTGALPLRWHFDPAGWSPTTLETGSWTQAQAA